MAMDTGSQSHGRRQGCHGILADDDAEPPFEKPHRSSSSRSTTSGPRTYCERARQDTWASKQWQQQRQQRQQRQRQRTQETQTQLEPTPLNHAEQHHPQDCSSFVLDRPCIAVLAYEKIVRWSSHLVATRIGEASNPGPDEHLPDTIFGARL
eukprot:671526-Amphidinium_carterae.1